MNNVGKKGTGKCQRKRNRNEITGKERKLKESTKICTHLPGNQAAGTFLHFIQFQSQIYNASYAKSK